MKISTETRTRFDAWRQWLEPQYANDLFDWSEDALEAFYAHTTHGTSLSRDIFDGKMNGYLKAEEVVNLHVTEWRDDYFKGSLFKFEILQDETIPFWLREAFQKAVSGHFVEHFAARDHILLRSKREGWPNVGSVLYQRGPNS